MLLGQWVARFFHRPLLLHWLLFGMYQDELNKHKENLTLNQGLVTEFITDCFRFEFTWYLFLILLSMDLVNFLLSDFIIEEIFWTLLFNHFCHNFLRFWRPFYMLNPFYNCCYSWNVKFLLSYFFRNVGISTAYNSISWWVISFLLLSQSPLSHNDWLLPTYCIIEYLLFPADN